MRRPLCMAGLGLLLLAVTACTTNRPRDLENPSEDAKAADIYLQLAVAYLRENRLPLALGKIERSLELDPGSVQGHNVAALIHERLGQLDAAEREYRAALQLDPKDFYVRNAWGTFLCKRGRYREADAEFQTAAAHPLNQAPWVPLTNAGLCAREQGELDRAEEYLRRALSRNSGFALALLQMARVSYDRGEYLTARAYLQRYHAGVGAGPDSLLLGVQVERALGDGAAASDYRDRLLKNFPDSREVQLLREFSS